MAKKDFKILPYKKYNYFTHKFNFLQKDTSSWGQINRNVEREASQGGRGRARF
jgi:hypothetical protein